jgi:hypothetical protein
MPHGHWLVNMLTGLWLGQNRGLKLVVPNLILPTETDRWVLTTSAATLVVDWSNQLTSPGPHRRRAVNDYSGATGTPGTLRSLKTTRGTSADYKVSVLWPIGHRSNFGDVPERRMETVYHEPHYQSTRKMTEGLGRLRGSRGMRRDAWWGQVWSKSPISSVASSGQRWKGTADSPWLSPL